MDEILEDTSHQNVSTDVKTRIRYLVRTFFKKKLSAQKERPV